MNTYIQYYVRGRLNNNMFLTSMIIFVLLTNEIVTILYHPYVLVDSNVLACILFRCTGTVVAEHVEHGFAARALQIGGKSPYIFVWRCTCVWW
jgi:hypothetical protein